MGSLARKIERKREIDELLNIRNLYHKKPKNKCPKFKRKSLFLTNDKGDIFCIRCDQLVNIKEK
jgi:hypothetical protein